MDYHTCRTCLANGGDLNNLFNHIINGNTLSQMLADCVQVKVIEDGVLPHHICNECTQKLISAWAFKELAMNSEQELRDYIGRGGEITMLIKEEHCEDTYENIGPLNALNQDEMIQVSDCIQPEHNAVPLYNVNHGSSLSVIKNKHTDDFTDAQKGQIEQAVDKLTQCSSGTTLTNAIFAKIVTSNEKPEIKLADMSHCKEESILMKSKQVENSNQCSNNSTLVKDSSSKSKPKVHCKKCNKIFSHYYYSKVHVHAHTGFKCNTCGKTFTNNYQLMNHKTTDHKTQPHICYICGQTFKTYLILRTHRTTHKYDSATRDVQKRECIICKKVFKTQYTLYYHHKTVHVEKKAHTCTTCNEEFLEKKDFTRHILKHKEEWIFMCEVCGKSCPTHGNLKLHTTTNNTEKIIPCPTCGKRFSSDTKLRRHLVWHTEEKAFTCDYCDKAFKTSFAKKRHILIHTGERPYSCKICDKKFADTAVLSRHMLTHTGETPFSCDKCA
ncbi:zinc-finger associated domain containing protein, partial [Oryctes borbonicus]